MKNPKRFDRCSQFGGLQRRRDDESPVRISATGALAVLSGSTKVHRGVLQEALRVAFGVEARMSLTLLDTAFEDWRRGWS